MHEIIKSECNSETIEKQINGKIYKFKIAKSTATLKTDEFEEFCAEVRRWGMKEFNIYLPNPNEVD